MKSDRDLLGFEHENRSFSWPEFDEFHGGMTRPAHAHTGTLGVTACGEPWPHQFRRGKTFRTLKPGEAPNPDIAPSAGMVPTPADYARIRDSANRAEFLCPKCCQALGITPP